MMKYLLIGVLFLTLVSLYIKSKKIKKINKFVIVFLLGISILSFQNKDAIILSRKYLYGASDFEKYAEYAQESMKETGVYASLTLAQAAQEQGLKVPSTNNLFGIKADSSCSGSVVLDTTECNGSGCYSTKAAFCTYETVEGSFTDHGYWLTGRFANRGEFNSATTLEDQLKSLKSNPTAMYATDPNYLCSLVNIINKYDLTKYDEGITYSGRGITIVGEHISDFKIENCASVGGNTTIFNSGLDYNPGTSYKGDYKNGYLFRLLNNGLVDENQLLIDLENGDADIAISEIYGRVVGSFGYGSTTYDSNIVEVGGIDPGLYSSWKQYDSRWAGIPLGTSPYNMKSSGCAATSVAIQISRSGVKLANEFTSILNPGSFVSYLNAHGGFTSGGAIVWSTASTVAPDFVFHNQVKVNSSNVLSTISEYLNSGNYYLIAHLKGSKRNNTNNHWVAVTGVTSNDIYMIDPGRNGTSLEDSYGISNVDRLSIYLVN